MTDTTEQTAPGLYDIDDRPVDTAGYWQRLCLAELLDIPTDDDALSTPDVGMWERAYGAACRANADVRHDRKERHAAATERDKLREALAGLLGDPDEFRERYTTSALRRMAGLDPA